MHLDSLYRGILSQAVENLQSICIEHIWIWTVRIKTDGLAKQSLQSRNGTSSLAVSHKANSHSCPNEQFSSSLDQLCQILLRRPRQWHRDTQLFRYLRHLHSQVLANIGTNNRLVD